MHTLKLSFQRKLQKKQPQVCSGDRPYIDFLINEIPLSDFIGGVNNSIGKFGWGIDKINKEFELSELNELREAQGSRHKNKLYSIYVCAECGDEGCGALMFDIEVLPETIQWNKFVWSNGDEIEVQNIIPIEPIVFDKLEYEKSMTLLEQMIVGY